MFARVATVQVQVEKLDEAIEIYREGVLTALQDVPGFEGVELLVNRDTGHGISITRWATEADQLASEASGFYRAQVGKFRGLFDAMPVREVYEVAVFA
ncbi:MAG TPA: antibiotic biosynthesis monooxygenase [Thermomicrobiales bacterium]|nr:antibiotic biosynthesis monooxygenase [Thermomicrobiales bacterium]